MENEVKRDAKTGTRRTWVIDGPPEGQRKQWHRLAGALRALNEALMETKADEATLESLAEQAELLLERMDSLPGHRPMWGFAESSNSGDRRAHFDASPVMGQGNAVAPPVKVWPEGDTVKGSVVFGTAYEGPPGHVHGGWVAAAFDEVLGMIQSLTGLSGMTGTLEVKYLKPTPLHRELKFHAEVDRLTERKIFASGTLHDGETLCATATAIFVAVDFSKIRQMAEER